MEIRITSGSEIASFPMSAPTQPMSGHPYRSMMQDYFWRDVWNHWFP
jgi:hypothetical protein